VAVAPGKRHAQPGTIVPFPLRPAWECLPIHGCHRIVHPAVAESEVAPSDRPDSRLKQRHGSYTLRSSRPARFLCPTEHHETWRRFRRYPTWLDERNHAYGYNFQFLGNTRPNSLGEPTHFPVKRDHLTSPSETVVCADSMGTAAGFPAVERTPYENDGTTRTALGNHAWTLDPPRLTAVSSRGTQNQGRGGVDPRHQGRANTLFVDGHVGSHRPSELGYRLLEDGRFADLGDAGLLAPPNNRWFSGNGQDLDPPPQHF
jgi:prepilin-type processing-associated H-X9-DG protein